jgi:hypothetical protein
MTAAQTVGDIDKLNELKEEEAEKAKSKCVLKLLLSLFTIEKFPAF